MNCDTDYSDFTDQFPLGNDYFVVGVSSTTINLKLA